MLEIQSLPTLNAALNLSASICLVTGWILIRQGRRDAHRLAMIGALACSLMFLTSYVIYHYHAGSRPFTGQGLLRPIYFTILVTHVILAAAILPLAIVTVSRAVGGRFPAHRRIARYTLPIWLYVSVTGVVVYVMLYRL